MGTGFVWCHWLGIEGTPICAGSAVVYIWMLCLFVLKSRKYCCFCMQFTFGCPQVHIGEHICHCSTLLVVVAAFSTAISSKLHLVCISLLSLSPFGQIVLVEVRPAFLWVMAFYGAINFGSREHQYALVVRDRSFDATELSLCWSVQKTEIIFGLALQGCVCHSIVVEASQLLVKLSRVISTLKLSSRNWI